MARQKKVKDFYTATGKKATLVEQLRKRYKISFKKAGQRADLSTTDIDDKFNVSTDISVERGGLVAGKWGRDYTSYGDSQLGVMYMKYMNEAREMNPGVPDSEIDLTPFFSQQVSAYGIKKNQTVRAYILDTVVGKEGKVQKGKRTETKMTVRGGSGYIRRLQTVETSNLSGVDIVKQIREDPKFKYGSLTLSDYDRLANASGGKKLFNTDNFRAIFQNLGVDSRKKAISKITQNPQLGHDLMDILISRGSTGYTARPSVVEEPDVEIEYEEVESKFTPYIVKLKNTQREVYTFLERNLIEFLRDPDADDETLMSLYQDVIEDGVLQVSLKDISEKVYNDMISHIEASNNTFDYLSQMDVEEFKKWTEENFRGTNNFKYVNLQDLKALKGKISDRLYNEIMEFYEEGKEIPSNVVALIQDILKGYKVFKAPSNETLFEMIQKNARHFTPIDAVRLENWFTAAIREFGDNQKYFPMLIDLASRIADEQGYGVLFEDECGINVWYNVYGDSDERVEELISNLESVSGLARNENLLFEDDEDMDESSSGEYYKKYYDILQGRLKTKQELDEFLDETVDK